MLRYIDRFGAQAVVGRMLGAGEINRMVIAEEVVRAYRSRAAEGENWAEWADKHKRMSRLLNEAAKLVEDLNNG